MSHWFVPFFGLYCILFAQFHIQILGISSGFLAMDNDHSLIFLAIKLDIPCLSSRFIQRNRLLLAELF